MDWKLLVLLLLTAVHTYRFVLEILQYRSANNPTPKSVEDVYDAETYQKWKHYCAAHSRLQLISTALSYALTLILLLTHAFSAFATLFPADNVYLQLIAVVLLDTLASLPLDVVISYVENLRIEEKYGFNRTTVKTFVLDRIRSFLIGLLFSIGLASLLASLYIFMGDWLILLFAAALFAFSLLLSFLYPFFSRIGNKFTPLEDGELKDRLMGLLTKHGYRVKAIEVMDASRRTTKLNAYFTGFGKMKTIVLYDNLVNSMSIDEICAVAFKKVLSAHNMTTAEAAEDLDVLPEVWKNICSGKFVPSKNLLFTMALTAHFTVSETEWLLALCGYELDYAVEKDVVISYLLSQKVFNGEMIKAALAEYKVENLFFKVS
ncbi:MAG: M48 family metalloprotease [Clostridia bacterium]|nr:M48 family metalloprotease [Clostridia bacterium]